jgi:hypothetical protein
MLLFIIAIVPIKLGMDYSRGEEYELNQSQVIIADISPFAHLVVHNKIHALSVSVSRLYLCMITVA